MPLAHVINLDDLLSPISESAPQGADIREDRSPNSDYYSVKDARNSARAAERSSLFDDDVDLTSPWKTVVEIAPKIISKASKDLEVASWYLEGLIRLEGLAGLRDGIQLLHDLVDQYWDGLFPLIDEDGIETKVAPLTGLNGDGGDGTLLTPIRNIPITIEYAGDSFSFWLYQQVRDAERVQDEDERSSRLDNLGLTPKDIADTIQATQPKDCVEIVATLEQCVNLYKAMSAKLRIHCKSEAPPSSNISTLLEEILRTTRHIYQEKLAAAQAESAIEDEDRPTVDGEGAGVSANAMKKSNAGSGPITDREDALKRLAQVAQYFRTYEPHTPIAPSLERLISWGRMTVSELMMELLPDQNAKGVFSQLTGVRLDGSDTKVYTAPPQQTTSESPASQSTVADPAEEPAKVGW